MPTAVSLYVYRLRVFERNGRKVVDFDDSRISTQIPDFLDAFVAENVSVKEDHERQRVWFFDKPKRSEDSEVAGHIRYGVFGFESELIDTKTKKKQYDRKSTDYEQIPLYYQFWSPENSDFALLAFQSFSGRSCIGYVNDALKARFKELNAGLSLRIEKITPQLVSKSTFANAEVKQVVLSKRGSSRDLANFHGASKRPKEVEVEVRVSARSGSFGRFRELDEASLKQNPVLYSVGGGAFQKATAQVEINGKTRRVGVFGDNGNAGAFEVTYDVSFEENGHPEFNSIDDEANDILSDTHSLFS